MDQILKGIRLTNEQSKRLEILAAFHQTNSSEYLRQLIDQEWDKWQPAIVAFTQPQPENKEPA